MPRIVHDGGAAHAVKLKITLSAPLREAVDALAARTQQSRSEFVREQLAHACRDAGLWPPSPSEVEDAP